MNNSTIKRALIATHNLIGYGGSEIFSLELAIELREMGWEVLTAALLSGEPMLSEFQKQGFRVVDMLESPSLLLGMKFDLVWVHHSPVYYDLLVSHNIQAGRLVFCSLSHFEPLEAVPEHRASIDLLLANSIENRDFIMDDQRLQESEVVVFPNAVPTTYWSQSKESRSYALTSVAVVSNHPAKEVVQAVAELKRMGLIAEHIGVGGTQARVTPALLRRWDAVITIGKTVPYCFALRIPVYCYDHFGGPGWLTDDSLVLARNNNFSGRGFERKTAELIAKELVGGYPDALLKVDFLRSYAMQALDLRKNLQVLLNAPTNRRTDKSNLMDARNIIRQHLQYVRLARFLRSRQNELVVCQQEVRRVKSTFSWRIGTPGRVIYHFLRRIISAP